MPRIRVALADDHRLVIEAVRATLEDDGDFDVVTVAESARQLLSQLAHTAADVVVLDVAMPGTDGFACLRELRERHPRVKVVMLSAHDEPRIAQRALRLGAAAYVRKQVDPRDLASALRQAVEETVASHSGGPTGGRNRRRRSGAADRGRARRASRAGARSREQADRGRPADRPADRQVPSDERLSQARRGEPDRGDPLRVPARARRARAGYA